MKEFFKVVQLSDLLDLRREFSPLSTETVPLCESLGRVLGQAIESDVDIPGFTRSSMDGYAVKAASTFGASDSSPAFLTVAGSVGMGESPRFSIGSGQAAEIATGGMLPAGSDSVVMLEHTDTLADHAIEVFKSVAPGQNVIEKGEDLKYGKPILTPGRELRPQELGLLAACGLDTVRVYRKPVVGIISTGDEVIPIDKHPQAGQIRDINSFSLNGLVTKYGATPVNYGIVEDNFKQLQQRLLTALTASDMVLISGGSSVGARDLSMDVLESLPNSHIRAHGISISPGKPTIMAQSHHKILWGLPGHVTSAMVVFWAVVRPFLHQLTGMTVAEAPEPCLTARLTRNLTSVQGRVDFIRVHILEKEGQIWAEPVLGKSGLIRTMIDADGLIALDLNLEGLEAGVDVTVYPI